jgi:uncharacterized membrane-anchored protein YhcB (DUF1043 family)
MNEVGMEVKIQANVQEAIKGLEHLGQEFVDLQKDGTTSVNTISGAMSALKEAVNKATDTGSIAKYNKALEALAGESVRIKSIGLETPLKKTASASDQAAFALTNLGRVVQDAPFGFIGISNNINPLLESFQRLNAETKGTGGALKALGQSLIGAGGLGLAVSVATSLMLVFGDSLFRTKKATDETKKSTDDYAESAGKEILKLNELISVATDEGQSRSIRLAAVQKLKSEYPNYLKGLSDEKILAGQVGDAYNKINEALLAKVALQAAEEKIVPLLKQQVELSIQLQKVNQTLDLQRREGTANGFKSANTLSKMLLDDNKTLTQHNSLLAQQTVLQNKINAIQRDFASLLKISAPLDLVFKPDTKKAEKNLLDAANRFDFTQAYLQLQLRSREALKQVDLFGGKDGGLSGFKLPTIVPPALPLIGLGDKANDTVINDRFKTLQDNIQATADLLNTVLAPAFDAAFSAVEQGKNVFAAIGDSIKKVVLELVKAAIEAAIFSVIINAVTGGAGTSFLGIFGKLAGLGNLFPHADGGIITKPLVAGQHLFGEAGKEAVIPLDRINEFLRPSSQSDGLVMTHAIRGDDLLLILNRANRSAGRNK